MKLDSKISRFFAWYNMMIVDHGFLRLIYHNFHKVDENVYRSNMPTPNRIKKYKKLGIKTILNLRGSKIDGGYLLEKEACKETKIELINLVARSRGAPEKEMIIKANNIFNKISFPVLIHCKSGADRAGLLSALYELLYCKKHPSIAKKQLSLKYLHLKWAKTGILDAFINCYQKHLEKEKKLDFLTWVEKRYDPNKLEDSFKENSFFEKLLCFFGRE